MTLPNLTRRKFGTGAAALGAALLTRSAAADDWPSRVVRLVVPFPPGGANDAIGRVVADRLTKVLGETVVVENRPGAGGSIGAAQVANATPDGYTILFGYIGNLAFAKSIYPSLPYDPLTSFVPISNLALTPTTLIVNPSVPVHSVKELIDYSKSRPGQMSYSSGGNGTAAHITMAYFCHQAGLSMVHVPYRGTAPSVTDLIAGQVQVTFAAWPGIQASVKAGRIRALAVSSSQRVPYAPQLPTVAEAGLPGFESTLWYGMLAPANTPKAIVTRLDSELEKIMKMPDVLKYLSLDGGFPAYKDSEAFHAFIGSEIDRWGKIIRAVGIART
jgi:tripartite-type tricarboxylate transporter receptor subunit TctC